MYGRDNIIQKFSPNINLEYPLVQNPKILLTGEEYFPGALSQGEKFPHFFGGEVTP